MSKHVRVQITQRNCCDIYSYDTNWAFVGYSKKIQGFKVDKMAKIPKSQYMLLDSRAVLQYCMFLNNA